MKSLILVLASLCCSLAAPAAPRVLPEGTLPDDKRLAPLRDLNGYFPFTPPGSKDQWAKRAKKIRHDLKVAVGLFPEP
ncbi:MAG: hypothetical protein VCA40_08160, partial [Roseibacillus sp.]